MFSQNNVLSKLKPKEYVMNPHDLAWKGVTVKEKRKLLKHSIQEKDRLIAEGKAREGWLGLGSTCVDVIGTARAKGKHSEFFTGLGWDGLLVEAVSSAKEVMANVGEPNDEWLPSDYEVAAVLLMKTEIEPDAAALNKAERFLNSGIQAADFSEVPHPDSKVLLLSQKVRLNMMRKEVGMLQHGLERLTEFISDISNLHVLTRVHRSLAEGHKFLAIHYAEEASAENQVLKARAI
jgi:hypothetical protein